MIDWASVLCGSPGPGAGAVSHGVPLLLRTFLVFLVRCEGGLRASDHAALCYPPRTVRVGVLTYTEAPLGVVVSGVNLTQPVPRDVIQQLRRDVHVHRVLIFKKQGQVSGQRQVEISRWFGPLEVNYIGRHRASPHEQVVRLSNNPEDGFYSVGAQGWHVDGTVLRRPTSIAIYHIVAAAREGATDFVPLTELVESLPANTRAFWDRLWRTDVNSTSPLIYSHPVTAHPAMLIHTAKHRTFPFILDHGTDQAAELDAEATEAVRKALEEEIEKDNRRLVYSHKWEEGDLLITDNLALVHRAAPETLQPPSEIGLRILHRTTVEGKWVPEKDFGHYRRQQQAAEATQTTDTCPCCGQALSSGP